ncbi:hypothetical protein OAH18_00300 [bacterium]|nr:hypothetical protein [bacterium]
MNYKTQSMRICCVVLLLTLLVVDQLQASVLSTARFVELKPWWSDLAKNKTRIIVEGRFSSRAASTMRLQNCDVSFQPASGKRLPTTTDRKKNIELSGYLKRSGGRYKFVVERHSVRKSDIERLNDSKLAITDSKADRWYKLGRETAGRAEFFDDDELRLESELILTEAVHREERALKPDDIKGLRALAERVKELNLDDRHRLQLLHNALWVQWRAEKKRDTTLAPMLQQIAADLPGAKDINREFEKATYDLYLRRPSAIYRDASDTKREILHRYFWLSVRLTEIQRTAVPDGKNGYEIARLIETSVPELKDLSNKYRRQQLELESSRLARLSQAEMRQLSQRYQAIGEQQLAQGTVAKWLKLLEQKLRPNGASGLIRMANLYRDELKDKDKEIALLKEAWSLLKGPEANQDRQDLENRLAGLGWSLRNQKWVQGVDQKQADRAIRNQPGGVEVGMTPTEVLKVLNGQPTSKVRVAAKDTVTELWVYRDSGLVVQFSQSLGSGLTAVNVRALR